jgi:hypothetical protein
MAYLKGWPLKFGSASRFVLAGFMPALVQAVALAASGFTYQPLTSLDKPDKP